MSLPPLSKNIPTDPVSAAIWGIDLLIGLLALPDAYERLRTGIAAQAEKERRDVTEGEQAILDAMLARSEQARDGKSGDPTS